MQSKIGEVYDGKITGLTNFGAFVKLSNGESGMVHISEVASVYVKEIKDFLSEGQDVKVKVLAINENKISLSIKQALANVAQPSEKKRFENGKGNDRSKRSTLSKEEENKGGALSFEEMMAKFKQVSDEKMSDLKRSSDSVRPRRSNNRY